MKDVSTGSTGAAAAPSTLSWHGQGTHFVEVLLVQEEAAPMRTGANRRIDLRLSHMETRKPEKADEISARLTPTGAVKLILNRQ